MNARRAIAYGVLGAAAMSVFMAMARSMGMAVHMELMLGTMLGFAPSPGIFIVGLLLHLMMGGLFGLAYSWAFERLLHHGGAAAGALLSVPHALLAGLFMAVVPFMHPGIPESMPAPGAFMSNLGAMGVVAVFMLHLVFGLIVGAGYGHVHAERPWSRSAHA